MYINPHVCRSMSWLYSPKNVAVEVCMRAVQQQHGVFNRKLLVSALWSDDDRVLGRQKSEFDEGEMIIYHIFIYPVTYPLVN